MTLDPVLAMLRERLEGARLTTDPTELAAVQHDDAEWAAYGSPVAMVQPGTAQQVQQVVRWAVEHGVPLVPRGAGTGLSGAANAVDGCLMVSFTEMADVVEIDPLERLAVVQPGVINDDLRRAVAEHGLWYPPDPASSPWSTIGGNVATNAGGICCVKYGVTRDYVLALQVVTGTGELVRLGHRTAKGVTGLDLTSLMVGSEGTLGLVTEITVRLRPLPEPPVTVVGYFTALTDAGRAVRDIGAAGLEPSALELVDRVCLEAVRDYAGLEVPADVEVLLIAQVDDAGEAGSVAARVVERVMRDCDAASVAQTRDPQESRDLMAARRLAYPALERLGDVLTEDVCVPKGRVPEMLRRIEGTAAEYDTRIANIAHAGDGNLHPLILVEPGDDEGRARAGRAFSRIIGDALELGGTVTGEHGVGLLKAAGMERELGPEVLAMQRAVKKALDPHGILNPGKAV